MEDSFMESNDKKVQLYIKDKEVKLVSGQRADVTLKTNIADLSSLVIGAIPLEAFLWTGRMQCSDTAYARDIQNAIGWSQKPKNYTYF